MQYQISSIVAVVGYIFLALGLYTIAKRRGTKNPWLAWIPMVNVWVLGCIADQYRYVTKGQIKARRKTLLILAVVTAILSAVASFAVLGMFQEIAPYMPTELTTIDGWMEMFTMTDEELDWYLDYAFENSEISEFAVTGKLIVMGILATVCGLAVGGVSIALVVVEMICYYELFAAADPQSGNTYFALGLVGEFIGLNVLMPIFVFVVRNKDLGMYSPNVPVYNGQVVYTQQENM